MGIRFLRGTLVALAATGALAGTVAAQSSANYTMERVIVASGATTAVSPNYRTSVTVSQRPWPGASSACNTGYRISLGFWSIAGAIPVPVDLGVRHSPSDPRDVELIWTGADPLFQVYRSSSPSDITGALNLYQETSLCAFTDTSAHQESILYYLVLPRP